jgi:aspartate-semialdehyde dehydrogenase
MTIAVIGATGLVGREMLTVLEEFNFPVSRLLPVASTQSVGLKVRFRGQEHPLLDIDAAVAMRPDIALFSAGSSVSKEYAPVFAAHGSTVIDNSSYWRLDPAVPLVVPEVNGNTIGQAGIIANPNCSTIQLVVVLQVVHRLFGLKRVVVSTYQAVTGSGKRAVDQLLAERRGNAAAPRFYPHPIDLNVLPHIDVFLENGYTKEEMKIILESRKILGIPNLAITATTVRVPVVGGHSESVNIECEQPVALARLRSELAGSPGIVLQDEPEQTLYPMPLTAHQKNEVFVGRIRKDESVANGLNLWITADNLRKGAATNAVQIAQLIQKDLHSSIHKAVSSNKSDS